MNLLDTPVGRLAVTDDLLKEISKFNIDGHYPIKKFYEVDPLLCLSCGGKIRSVAILFNKLSLRATGGSVAISTCL